MHACTHTYIAIARRERERERGEAGEGVFLVIFLCFVPFVFFLVSFFHIMFFFF